MSDVKRKARPQSKQEEQEDINKLNLNSEFAKKYEFNKRREILSSLDPGALEELEAESSADSEDDEEEDELGELLTKKLDKQISNTFLALRNKDPSIYDKKTVFFKGSRNDMDKSSDEDDSDSDSGASSGDEPVAGWDSIAKAAEAAVPKLTIKDYVRETLLEEGDLPDSDAERFIRRRHVEEENEQVAQEKTKLHDSSDSDSSSDTDSSQDKDDGEGKKRESDSDDSDDSSSEEDSSSSEEDAKHKSEKAKKTAKSSDTLKPDSSQSLKKSESSRLENDKNSDADESEDDDDDGEFFKKKVKTAEELEQEEKDFDTFTQRLAEKKAGQSEEKELHAYLEKESAVEKDRFLRNFVLNNGWLDLDAEDANEVRDADVEIDIPNVGGADVDEEDDELEDKADEFEAKYNFRFEEPDGVQVASHARDISSSLRRPDDRRKRAREAKKQRKEKEKLLKGEEIKQLKNLKKKEIQSRLLALQEAAGTGMDFSGIDLDADFDPDEFSKQMEGKFGDEYYTQEDEQLKAGEDEEVLATHKKPDAVEVVASRNNDGAEVEPGVHEAVDKLMDEYYNLDYEDIIGGVPVRFKYKEVESETFGMTAEEILIEDDKELNNRASLKFLAPYRDRKEVKMRAKTARWRAKQRRRAANGSANRAAEAHESAYTKPVVSNLRQKPNTPKEVVRHDAQNTTEAKHNSKKRDPSAESENQVESQDNNGTPVKKKRKKRRFGKKVKADIVEAPKLSAKDKKKKSAIEGLSDKRLAAYNISKSV